MLLCENMLVWWLVSIMSFVMVFCKSFCYVSEMKFFVILGEQCVLCKVDIIILFVGVLGSVSWGLFCSYIDVFGLCCVGNQMIDGIIVVLVVYGVNVVFCLMLFCSMQMMVFVLYSVEIQGVVFVICVVLIVMKIRLICLVIVCGLVSMGLGMMILLLLKCNVNCVCVEWLQIIGVWLVL